MKKLLLFARSNIRRAKGQTVTVLALVLLATVFLHLWLMLALDYRQNFVRVHDKLHAEHVTLVVTGGGDTLPAFLAKTISEDERAVESCLSDAVCIIDSVDYSGGTITIEFVGLEKQAALERAVGAYEIVEDSGASSGVYLPYLFSSSGNYRIGDTFKLSVGQQTQAFPVIGFFNSAMTGSINCGMTALLFTEDIYRTLGDDFGTPATLASVRLHRIDDGEKFVEDMSETIQADYPTAKMTTNHYAEVYQIRYITQMICSGIIGGVSVIITAIALTVLASNLVNFISENMRNLGALKAMGYTSRQLILAFLLEFLGLSLLAVVAGTALSYALSPALTATMTAQVGIPYAIRFLPVPFLLTLALILGIVALTVWLSVRRLRKLEPITALRQGVRTHSFQKNHVPLERTRAPLSLALALKTALSGLRQNVILFLTMLAVSLLLVFSGLMYRNIIVDFTPVVELVLGESPSTAVGVSADGEESLLASLREDARVEKLRLYSNLKITHAAENGSTLMATVSEDFSALNFQSICYEGRYPLYSNEVAISGKYAREHGIRLGQEITLAADKAQETFLVCGFTQLSNYLGKECLLTREGCERIADFSAHPSHQYYVDLREGTDIDAFNEELSQTYDGVLYTVNYDTAVGASISVYQNVITLLIAAILLLSVLIVAFILYLLVRTLLRGKAHDYGILKALGYTTGQLILQTALSFLPVFIFSAAVGFVVSARIVRPLTALLLSGLGVVRCTFIIPVGFLTLAGIGLVAFAFLFTCLLSRRIRRIAPRTMLTNE